jgi:hypothetical protein
MKILFAHNSANLVKKGDKVKKGDYIGEIGTANGKWIAHLHLSASEGLSVAEIKSYIVGWSKTKVQKYYRNPKDLFSGKDLFDVPIDEGNAGYDWLQWIGNGYHSGVDYNGLGGGNTDYGYKIKTPFDGEIIESTDWKGGWGKCVVLQVNTNMKKANQEFYDSKVKGQGWTNLEDWVEGAREYREERDNADKQIDKLVSQYRKLIKDQDNLNKAHDLELTRQKNALTTEFNAKLKDLQEELEVCKKIRDGALEMSEDDYIKNLQQEIFELKTQLNEADIEIAKLKSEEGIIRGAIRIISNYIIKWKK